MRRQFSKIPVITVTLVAVVVSIGSYMLLLNVNLQRQTNDVTKPYVQELLGVKSELARIRNELSVCKSALENVRDNVTKVTTPKPRDKIVRSDPVEIKDAPSRGQSDGAFERTIPENRLLKRNMPLDEKTLRSFQKRVTLLIYNPLGSDCVSYQLTKVREVLPNITIYLAASHSDNTHVDNANIVKYRNEGDAMNSMIAKVKTEMFLYLSEGAVIESFRSDNSVGWLLDALDQIPEMDIIGSSLLRSRSDLKYTYLDIHCHKLRMCYWKLLQTYEYRYSVGDLMICEETSPSFLARTASVHKVGSFDESLDSMVTTDFFYRAKNKITIGLRPEVFLEVHKVCTPTEPPHAANEKKRLKFMRKYSLDRVVDSHGVEYNLPAGMEYSDSFHWARHGGFLPSRRFDDMKFLLAFVAENFLKRNITYIVEGGSALGGIKLRGGLPWDTGDIDTLFWGNWRDVQAGLMDSCKHRKLPCITFTLPEKPLGNIPPELILKLVYHYASPYTMFQQPGKIPDAANLLYIRMNGGFVSVLRRTFAEFRKHYGIDYLANKDHHGHDYLKCLKPGHHACVPKQFAHGGGHWSDDYCR